jgi:hypothetical protein
MPKRVSESMLKTTMKDVVVHIKWHAVSLSCVASKLLATEFELTGNNGNETSSSLPCHGTNRTSSGEGTNSSLNIRQHIDCMFEMRFPYAMLIAMETNHV